MRWRHIGPAALAFLLCVVVCSLSLLAYASPPDPPWARGVYDDADFDDVVCFIVANSGLMDDAVSVEGRPNFVLIETEVPRDDLSVVLFSMSSSQSRAPPTR